MNKLLLVIKQEFKMTAANKAFVIITIIGPFLILAIAVLPTLFSSSPDSIPKGTTVAVLVDDDDFFLQIERAMQKTKIDIVRGESCEQQKRNLMKGELTGLLEIPENALEEQNFIYYSKTGTDVMITEMLRNIIGHTPHLLLALKMISI